MRKRDFIKTGFVGTLGLLSLPSFSRKNAFSGTDHEFKLPELPYAYDALEPFIDAKTMEIHHSKHHAGYTAKLNAGLQEAGIEVDRAGQLLRNASLYPQSILNNAGGYVNHRIFWKSLSPNGGGIPGGNLAQLIDRDFGSFEQFKELFNTAAKTQFGSGWAWLIYADGKLKVVKTANQDNPVMDTRPKEEQGRPLLCLDVWEHAYYLKYQNRRAEYIDAFWNIVNWDFANKKLDKFTKA